jgi:hypothetical protein
MYKTKSKTNEHGEHVYDSTAIGKVMYDPLEADVTKTFEAHIFKGEAHPGYVKVTAPLSVCEKLTPEQAREIAKALNDLADKAESFPKELNPIGRWRYE